MSKQYCFEIKNPRNINFDINELKLFVRNLYVGNNNYQFNEDEKIPFIIIYAGDDNNVCILMTSRSKNNINKIEDINRTFSSKDLKWKNGISLKKPYEFDVETDIWWNNSESKFEEQKWRSLRHRGPYFTDLMEQYIPLGASLYYNEEEFPLTPIEEKIASLYAKRLISEAAGGIVEEWTKDSVFNKNFWNDFKKYLTPEHRKIFKNFSKIDWSDLIYKIEVSKQAELTSSKKILKKIRNEEKKRDYGYAWIDGKREKIGNFIVEPQAIFYGRGENPNRGKIKSEILPENVTINIGETDPIPNPPPGHRWENVVHDHSGVWLARWSDSISGNIKYVMFSAEGRFKGEADFLKYEKARKLEMHIDTVRNFYMLDASSNNTIKMQLGTVLYLIDHFGVRVGNERKEDETDTVGASTLRVGHVKLKAPDHVIFDFLGKDSVRFYKDLKVPTLIYDNFFKLITGKNIEEQIFHSISSQNINTYLKGFDKSFSAKVFRTRLASKIMFTALKNVKIPKGTTKAHTKVLFNKANIKVAEILNHTRNVSKKTQDSVNALRKQLKDVKKELKEYKEAKRNIPKKLKDKEKSLKSRIEAKTDVMTVAINTSLANYIDPRMIVAWCKLRKVDISNIYTTALMRKFKWAIETIDKNWNWEDFPLNIDPNLEPLDKDEDIFPKNQQSKPYHIGPGNIKDYKLLLQICNNPEKYKENFKEISKEVIEWIVHFSRYAINKGVQIEANNYIIEFYDSNIRM